MDWHLVLRIAIKIVIIVIVSIIVAKIAKGAIGKAMERKTKGGGGRQKTIKELLQKAAVVIIYFVASVIILNTLGVNTTSIIASAGVLGLAISFGAQSLIKDLFTGFFIILDDYYAVGDYVSVLGISGTVEEVGLRSTKIRDYDGRLHIFPNGQITLVSNFSRGNVRGMVDINVSAKVDQNQVMDILRQVCEDMQKEKSIFFAEPPTVLGIENASIFNVRIRLTFTCDFANRASFCRILRQNSIEALNKAGLGSQVEVVLSA